MQKQKCLICGSTDLDIALDDPVCHVCLDERTIEGMFILPYKLYRHVIDKKIKERRTI